MNLISHNCLNGNIYKNILKQKYANPFIWTVIDFKSMLLLIQNWNNINFSKFELIKDCNWNFSILIENQINIQYVHYKFDQNSKTPRKGKDGDIFYNKIWKFITLKYNERLKRMLEYKENPIFCICNFKTIYADAIYSKNQLEQLKIYDNVKILNGCEKLNPMQAAKEFYNKQLKGN